MEKKFVDRLLKLADHLETVQRRLFDMLAWGHDNCCKTVCCALGHACSIPSFRRAGLRLKADRRWVDGRGRRNATYDVVFHDDFDQVLRGFAAAEKFFGLSDREAAFLFAAFSYVKDRVTPRRVAARIRRLVAWRVGA